MPNDTLNDAADQVVDPISAIRTFVTTVSAVQPLNQHMMQVTCAGGDLATYQPLGPDDFVYVLAPPRGRAQLTIDSTFTWSAYEQMAAEERPVGAYYTVRRWRPESFEIDLVIVLHGDGDGSHWGEHASPGDPVALWGPRRVYDPPAGTERFLFVGDETGMHAIAAILESLGPEVRADVIVECDGRVDALLEPIAPGVTVTCVAKQGNDAEPHLQLANAVRAIEPMSGGVYAWGGGESRSMTAVRRYLRDERGFDQLDVAMTAYWRCDATQP